MKLYALTLFLTKPFFLHLYTSPSSLLFLTLFAFTLQNKHIAFCSLNLRNNDFVVNGQEWGPLENTSSLML